ncbi:hypothetical protein WJX74_007883 [Apatococcus lobatus]|uniref:Uncharacterized protein n=1 Tax=Apatococcus lobatus TaxID=904363 RepID=A0AAW1S3J6_9CHLO
MPSSRSGHYQQVSLALRMQHRVKPSFGAICLLVATLLLGNEALVASALATAPDAAADAAFATVGPQFRRAPAGQNCQALCAAAGKKSATFPGANKSRPTDSLCAANPDGTGFRAGYNSPIGPSTCAIWHLNQLLAVPAFACMCLDAIELMTLTAHASVDTTCEDTCAAGELASGFGVKTDTTRALYACVPQQDVSAGNRFGATDGATVCNAAFPPAPVSTRFFSCFCTYTAAVNENGTPAATALPASNAGSIGD